MIVVVMGVTGAGKSTVGERLSRILGWRFIDADSLHQPSHVAKMRAGIPLTDEDRDAWIEAVCAAVGAWPHGGQPTVLACSALRARHRERLRCLGDVRFVHLLVDATTAQARVAHRCDHFMPASLVPSQFEALEHPPDALVLDGRDDPERIAQRIAGWLRRGTAGDHGEATAGRGTFEFLWPEPGSAWRLIDVSLPLRQGMVQWPGDPEVRVRRVLDRRRGDPVRLTEVAMSAHAGTHVDAPAHFLAEGAPVSSIALDLLVGPALVLDMGDTALLTDVVFETAPIPLGTTRLLLRTRTTHRRLLDRAEFSPDYAAVSPEGARWLVRKGIRLVGIDSLSIGPFSGGEETHVILLDAGTIIIEGLRLGEVEPGPCVLVCLPLLLEGAEASPARVVLVRGPRECS